MAKAEKYLIYLDTGGTFSDCVIIKGDGSFVTGKASTTPDDLATCFFNGIENAAMAMGKGLKEVLENCDLRGVGRWAGIHTLASMHVPDTDKPRPLVPRSLFKGVTERVDIVGGVVIPLNEHEVRKAVKELIEAG